jgi:hypothetical protein
VAETSEEVSHGVHGGHGGGSSTVDETFDTSFEVRFPKIQQISEAQVSQPDISQNLLCVNREQMSQPI